MIIQHIVTQESPRPQTLSNRQGTMSLTSDNMSQTTSASVYYTRKTNMEDISYTEKDTRTRYREVCGKMCQ